MTEKCMEKRLIEHCAPTLAGMKSASLFNYFPESVKLSYFLQELLRIDVIHCFTPNSSTQFLFVA